MKRHRFLLRKYTQCWQEEPELRIQALRFFAKTQSIPRSLRFVGSLLLADCFLPVSKVRSYCLTTGRVRFPITLTATSRHIFYERALNRANTGFFMSSW